MLRLVLGLFKGAAIGGLIGFGAYSANMSGGWNWITYGVIGVMIGLFVGRPIWTHFRDKSSTVVVSALKAMVGYGVCVGLYALVAKVWGGFDLTLADETRNITNWPYILGAAIGGIYGAWVELDDSVGTKEAA